MVRRLLTTLIVAGALVVSAAGAASAQPADRPTLAVADIQVIPGGWTLPPPQLGPSIAARLVDQLIAAQSFRVVDGQWLVPESESGGHVRLDTLRAAAAAQHVDYLVLGTVTGFGTEQRLRRGGGFLPFVSRLFGGGGFSRQRTETRLTLSLRVVDVRSGEIVRSTTDEGIGSRRRTSVGLLGVRHGLPLAAGLASSAIGGRDAMLDEAVQRAVQAAAGHLMISAGHLPAHAGAEVDRR